MPRLIALISFVFAASALVMLTGTSNAQYPPPQGSLTLTSSSVRAGTGSVVVLTCQARDASGAPIAGADCVVRIASQNGTNAAFFAVGSEQANEVVAQTDSEGNAYVILYTGGSPGTIFVGAQVGDMTSGVVVDIAGS